MQRKITLFIMFFLLVNLLSAQQEKYSKVKVFTPQKTDVLLLASNGLAMDNLERKIGVYIVGEFSESELDLIKQTGLLFEVIVEDVAGYYQKRNDPFDIDALNKAMKISERKIDGYVTPTNFKLGSMGGFHTYQELLDELDEMKSLYPNLISEPKPIGEITTIEDRPVYWVRISSNPEDDQEKPKVLYTALTHAREPASMQQMLYQMWYLLENYETNPEIQYLVNNLELFFIPCVNPDGYIYNQTTNPNGGGMWRKNRRNNGDGSIGIDLNRNFGYQWGYDNVGSSSSGSSNIYRGAAPFSEPETQLVKQFCEEREISLALNNHTYGDILIYPYSYENILTPDSLVFIEYAKRLTLENNYAYGTCYQTLNYFVNGGSDDWFYGEQETKNKIIAFTPEAGNASDGFWPQVNRIEEICAGHTGMNLYMARFALAYAELVDNTPPFLSEYESNFSFQIYCLGIDTPSMFKVSLAPISSNIQSVGNPVTFDGMSLLQTEIDSIPITLYQSVEPGEELIFALSVNNGSFTRTDTIVKHFGATEILVEDYCDDMTSWTSSLWNITDQYYFSGPTSINDSPNSNYYNNTTSSITLNSDIDLADASMAYVEFMARWAIEANWDFAQFLVMIDGQSTWIPLGGKYTVLGGANQHSGKPLYHGRQNQWVKEIISLNDYVGKSVSLRFRLVSDASVNDEGFFFDDFRVVKLLDPNYTSVSEVDRDAENVRLHYYQDYKELKIQWNSVDSFDMVEIIDLQGRIVYSRSTGGQNTHRITTSNTGSGIYIVRLKGKQIFTGKVLL